MKQMLLTIVMLLSIVSISQTSQQKEEILLQDHYTLIDYATYDSTQPCQLKSIELPGRVSLEYAERGNANGIPVIMLHGLSDSWHSYELVLEHLPNSIRAIALSLRGHGESGKPDSKYSPEDFADDVAAFMNELKIEKAIIVGHSMGSIAAQSFAMRYPQLTQSLVLIGAFCFINDNPGMIELENAVNKLNDPVDLNFISEFQKSTIMRPIPGWFFNTAVAESTKLPANVWKHATKAMMETNYLQEFKKITAPTLIIWGDKDLFTLVKDQETLKKTINNSRLVIYKGTGHAVHWEEPKRFAIELTAFVNESVNVSALANK